ncbi:MAG: NADH-quinone oxidoreductase subunit E [Betaproteobacteria bacterium]|nr:NADH-quinone oxidoreductase subunit E [Betaproteobacteria bacterium]
MNTTASNATDMAELSAETLNRFARETAKYPEDQKQSAVMACLTILQQEFGFVSPAHEKAVAHFLNMPLMAVHEVFTFYNMYNINRVGKFKINVCTNLPCQLRKAQQSLSYLCQQLQVNVGETTADGMFTVQPGECMGACADAPVLLVNDTHMCSFMSSEKIDQMLGVLRTLGGKP